MPILSAISSLQPRRFRARQTPRTPHETHQTSHPRLRMRGSTRPRKASRCHPCCSFLQRVQTLLHSLAVTRTAHFLKSGNLLRRPLLVVLVKFYVFFFA